MASNNTLIYLRHSGSLKAYELTDKESRRLSDLFNIRILSKSHTCMIVIEVSACLPVLWHSTPGEGLNKDAMPSSIKEPRDERLRHYVRFMEMDRNCNPVSWICKQSKFSDWGLQKHPLLRMSKQLSYSSMNDWWECQVAMHDPVHVQMWGLRLWKYSMYQNDFANTVTILALKLLKR